MPSQNAETPMLSPAEIARRLGVSKRTVLRWVDSGLLPAYRIGVLTRVRLSDFSTFLQQHRTVPGTEASDEREE